MSNKIRKLRFDNGEITQKELADLVGVSRQTMNAIENNKHAPTIDVAIRIADVFREAVDTLFEYAYDGKPDFLIVCVSFARDRDQIGADCND
jgi:putative transcriptional regulator